MGQVGFFIVEYFGFMFLDFCLSILLISVIIASQLATQPLLPKITIPQQQPQLQKQLTYNTNPMHLHLTLKLLMNARTKKPSTLPYQQLEQLHDYLLEKVAPEYSHSQRKHQDRVYEEVLYGKKCHVAGLTPDSVGSASYIQSICFTVNPDLIILGNFNSTNIISSNLAKTATQIHKVRSYDTVTQPSSLFCKSVIAPLIPRITHLSQTHVLSPDNNVVYYFDHYNRHVHALNHLTIFNRVVVHDRCRLMFGLPSDYIRFEDIMVNYSLEDLRQVWIRVLAKVKANLGEDGQQMESTSYYPELIIEEIRYHAQFQPILTQKQLTYTASVINHIMKSHNKTLIFTANPHVQTLSSQVHKTTHPPSQTYRNGYSHSNLHTYITESLSHSETGQKLNRYLLDPKIESSERVNQLREEVMEKFVMLNYMRGHGLERELTRGVLVFAKMVFRGLFQGVGGDQLKSMYQRVKRKYVEEVGEIIEYRISNLVNYKEGQKNFYTLPQMILTQQQRNKDFPAIATPKTPQTQHLLLKNLKELQNQIQNLIPTLSQSDQELIDTYFKGTKTRQNIVLYQKLLVQAKLRLKSDIKLPVFHFANMGELWKDQIKQFGRGKGWEKEGIVKEIQKLKKDGVMREVNNQEELRNLLNSNMPRISLNFQNGQVQFQKDGHTHDDLLKASKKDQLLADVIEFSKRVGDGDEHVFIEEDDMSRKKGREGDREGRRSGRRVRGKVGNDLF